MPLVAEESRGYQVLAKDWETGLKVVRDFGDQNSLYEHLVDVRGRGNSGPVQFPFDAYSYHYGLLDGELAVGTLTVTRLVDGILDCQSIYPSCILKSFHQEVFTTCKFRISGTGKSSFRTLRMMLRHAWRDQIVQGSRLVLINADQKLVPFYKRIGFEVIQDSEFVHPLLGTASICLLMRADPNSRSFFSDLFEKVEQPITAADIARCHDIHQSADDDCQSPPIANVGIHSHPFPSRHFQGA
ncbi:hypothetical protein N9N28_03775 [Rubripirellula amarantea]|uniref:N-acyl amino acid synthase FeeM domain-containing protein n=1 Tax=Rubripirellula amarantea TaxID=2527999 RepID=UPI0011B5DE7F|nr:hypothetical protein [Rubripirellula amarantea]MDA8743735.1 hypothetical protein [Rubripirellula amarantea]